MMLYILLVFLEFSLLPFEVVFSFFFCYDFVTGKACSAERKNMKKLTSKSCISDKMK